MKIKDGDNTDKYLKSTGDGSASDPYINTNSIQFADSGADIQGSITWREVS